MPRRATFPFVGITGLSLILLVLSFWVDITKLNARALPVGPQPPAAGAATGWHVHPATQPVQGGAAVSPSRGPAIDCVPVNPDVDDNGALNIRDVTLVASYFNQAAHPPAYDVNCSETMDVLDVLAVAEQWECAGCGETNPILAAWMVNRSGETSVFIRDAGQPVAVDVQDVYTQTVGGVDFLCVQTTAIPSYETEVTSALVTWLNSRPRAATDFVSGQTTATVGQMVSFGENIGYRSMFNMLQCPAGAGYGYWPPGPSCATKQTPARCFPLNPTPATSACMTGGGAIGLWVNGARVYNWTDGMSYQNQGVWRNIAAKLEVYDLDICPGHSAMGEYHHHSHPTCLQEQLGDVGQGHSAVYGFGADGYAIYGPWHAQGVLAQSCWKPRDYDTPGSVTGCGTAGARTCFLSNPADPSQGTTPAPQAGPTTSQVVTTLSGNQLVATSGFYIQDYYFDTTCAAQGGAALDANNGHEHDGMGYHYHTTRTANGDGTFSDTFPYFIGPIYHGAIPTGSFARCDGPPG